MAACAASRCGRRRDGPFQNSNHEPYRTNAAPPCPVEPADFSMCAFVRSLKEYVCRKVMGRMLAHSAQCETGITSRLAELTCRSAFLEGVDALVERRVAHEQLLYPLRDSAIDAEGRELLGKRLRGMRALECFERADHRARAGEISAACIRAEFTL